MDRGSRRRRLAAAVLAGAVAGLLAGLVFGLVGAPGSQVLGGITALWGLLGGAVLGVLAGLAVESRRAPRDQVRPHRRRRERRLPGPR